MNLGGDVFTYMLFLCRQIAQGGLADPLPLLDGLNPNISPTKPEGLGTGHSLFDFLSRL